MRKMWFLASWNPKGLLMHSYTPCPSILYVLTALPKPQVDATKESSLGKEHGIKGYPTMKWFVDGQATEYSGPRDA